MSSGEQVQSALIDGPFSTMQIGYVFSNVSVKAKPSLYPALSVGKQGVTPQLEGVAQQQGDGDKKLVTPGQIVLNSRSDRRGASGLSDHEGVVSVVYTVLQPNLEFVFPRFAHHLFRCVAFQEEYYRWGTGIVDDLWSTNFDRLAQIRIPLPGLTTQHRIAEYLDTEVGEMDAMVARLEKLIADLEARRKSVITEKVLGSRANGLITSRFWMAVELITDTDETSTAGVSLEDFVSWSGGLNIDSIQDREDELEGTPFKAGDLLFGKLRPYLAKSWIADDRGVASGDIHVYRARAGYDISYLGYLVRTPEFIQYAKSCSRGVKMPRVEWTALSQFQFDAPDLATQRRIAAELDEETAAIDGIITRSRTLIDDLKARKSALITEVVTGRKQV